MDDKTRVCLECWRDFTVDFLHLDCTGEHVVPRAEADELREWVTGRHDFAVTSGQAVCDGDHADCAPDEDGWHAFTCLYCGAAVQVRGKRRLKAEKRERFYRSMTKETDPDLCDCNHAGLPLVWHASCCEIRFQN